MTNIYNAPEANLNKATASLDGGGTLEGGIAGNYDFSIEKIIKDAWDRTDGSKGTVWLAILFYIIVLIPVSMIVKAIQVKLGLHYILGDPWSQLILSAMSGQLMQVFIVTPLAAGLFMVGLKLAVRTDVKPTEIFSYFPKVLSLVGAMLLIYVMVAIGFCLLIIPGIYLSVSYALTLPLIVDKNLSPWQAMEASRKAITHHWFKIFGLYLVMLVIAMIAAIPIGIGLIWAVPTMMIATGLVYHVIFGYEGSKGSSTL